MAPRSRRVDTDHEHSGSDAECEICRNNLPFDMPPELVEACASNRLVVFAGAGVSTENRAVLQDLAPQDGCATAILHSITCGNLRGCQPAPA